MLKLLAFAVLIAAGQLMFKRTAQDIAEVSGTIAIIQRIMFNPWFITATGLYVAATFLWTIALREIPLSGAYPFMALAFVLVPVGAMLFFGERLDIRYFIGLALVLAGIAVIGSGGVARYDRAEHHQPSSD